MREAPDAPQDLQNGRQDRKHNLTRHWPQGPPPDSIASRIPPGRIEGRVKLLATERRRKTQTTCAVAGSNAIRALERWLHDASEASRDETKKQDTGNVRRSSSGSNIRCKKAQDGTQMVPNGPEVVPMAHHAEKMSPRWPQDGQDGPKIAQDGTKMAPS